MDNLEEVQNLLSSIKQDIREKDVKVLFTLVSTRQIQDYELSTAVLIETIWIALSKIWKVDTGAESLEKITLLTWNATIELPDYNDDHAASTVTLDFVRHLLKQFDVGQESFAGYYKDILQWIYFVRKDYRVHLRLRIGVLLEHISKRDCKRAHVGVLLQVLHNIISNTPANRPSLLAYRTLLENVLLPLHAPNEMIDWRDQIPVLQRFHEPLVACLVKLAEKEKGMSPSGELEPGGVLAYCTRYILNNWPEGFRANTPKEVLYLHEVETLLVRMSPLQFRLVLQPLSDRLRLCMQHDNARPMQRALTMFKNEEFLALLRPHLTEVCNKLLSVLYRGGKLFWNPTVNKMTALALQNIQALDPEAFRDAANRSLGGDGALDNGPIDPPSEAAEKSLSVGPKEDSHEGVSMDPGGAAAGDVKRMRNSESGEGSSTLRPTTMMPPRAKPSLLPRQEKNTTALSESGEMLSGWRPGQGAPPPVTVTGVAPWAMGPGQKKAQFNPRQFGSPVVAEPAAEAKQEHPVASVAVTQVDSTGIGKLTAYMELCLPQSKVPTEPHWSTVQSLPSPTLLPELRFHDLVFGKDLGSGAFATVRYARHILKDKTRSDWPEYAVKVLSISRRALASTSAFSSAGKEQKQAGQIWSRQSALSAALKEIAVLKLLNHPGIARLISAFRYHGAIYLVNEYASEGDLHTHVITHGPLAHDEIRFVAGEVLSALLSISSLDLSYNDLKPENVVLTQAGHVKLVDFGACRPVSSRGISLLKDSVQPATEEPSEGSPAAGGTILSQLRNGDWRQTETDVEENKVSEDEERMAWDDLVNGKYDMLEGTPAYLPPEVLSGDTTKMGTSVDAWALGCLLLFLHHGRPIYFGDRETVLQQQQTSLKSSSDQPLSVRFDTGESAIIVPTGEDADLLDLANGLTRYEPSSRLSLTAVAMHHYLSSDSDPLVLHWKAPVPLLQRNRGKGNKTRNNKSDPWAQRQFSVVWSPLPETYSLESCGQPIRVGVEQSLSSRSTRNPHNLSAEDLAETVVECGAPFLPS